MKESGNEGKAEEEEGCWGSVILNRKGKISINKYFISREIFFKYTRKLVTQIIRSFFFKKKNDYH
jgi:hypothetical protein